MTDVLHQAHQGVGKQQIARHLALGRQVCKAIQGLGAQVFQRKVGCFQAVLIQGLHRLDQPVQLFLLHPCRAKTALQVVQQRGILHLTQRRRQPILEQGRQHTLGSADVICAPGGACVMTQISAQGLGWQWRAAQQNGQQGPRRYNCFTPINAELG